MELGLLRLSPEGKVLWRLHYQTHHSVTVDDANTLWVCGLRIAEEKSPSRPNYLPPYYDYTILHVSGDGRILEEIPVIDLLQKNNLSGLLYLSSLGKRLTEVEGDTLHLNDVDVFPSRLEPGFFRSGDIMISMRNINTVLVFDPIDRRVKFVSCGACVRQHDPDFVDGNTISVFDNNNVGIRGSGAWSRIVTISALDHRLDVAFQGSAATPFFTDIMGKHQWLPNGNLLITESMGGRAFEVDRAGKAVWQFINFIDQDTVGMVQEVSRLPKTHGRIVNSE